MPQTTTAGVIRFRAHWANDEQGLRTALAAIAAGHAPGRGRSRAMTGPLLPALTAAVAVLAVAVVVVAL